MDALLIALFAALGFIVAYWTYGRWLGSKIFNLSAKALCPSVELRDDTDYVPTSKAIVFGHHFTSIAGTGPIVGPAIAVIWGWLPALLWVIFGSIFIGAVHDFGALVVSLRQRGQTIAEVAGTEINRRARILLFLVLFLSLTIVLAIFGLVISAVFRQFPASIFPCVAQIPIAIMIGVWVHRKGKNILVPSIIALVIMYLSVLFGDAGALHWFNSTLAAWPVWLWVVVLLVYSYIASVLPVWTLLQPRDYINSLQLISTLLLVVIGLTVAAFIGGAPQTAEAARQPLEIVAPAIQFNPAGAPAILPFLFITIACGAISGFHCLVASGVSSKQLKNEADARFVGYGSMLGEGFLAVIVILACVAGLGLGIVTAAGDSLTGAAAWNHIYASWSTANGLGAKVGAFVTGAGNFLVAIGIPQHFAIPLLGVLVASFAATTLDSSCRLQRYVVQELFRALGKSPAVSSTSDQAVNAPNLLSSRYVATLIAVLFAFALAILPAPGQQWNMQTAGTGGLILWPVFGATNQLLGGLAFLVLLFYLWRRGKPIWFVLLPAIFMLVMPAWAMGQQIFFGTADTPGWLAAGEWVLVLIGLLTIALKIWMIVEASLMLVKVPRGQQAYSPIQPPAA